jgi:hypothetical protein
MATIATLSAVVVGLSPSAATLYVSINDEDGNALREFDDLATSVSHGVTATRGRLRIWVRFCEDLLGGTQYACVWSPLVNLSVAKDNASPRGLVPGSSGIYRVVGEINDEQFNAGELKDRKVTHALMVRAEVMPGAAVQVVGATPTPLSARQIIVGWPAIAES